MPVDALPNHKHVAYIDETGETLLWLMAVRMSTFDKHSTFFATIKR
jgi:hypothetical protein